MEEMSSFWRYHENVDELNQKLLYTTLELEKLKAESSEEMIKNREYEKQVIQLLKIAIQERNEARIHLQNYLNSSLPLTSPTEHLPSFPIDSLFDAVTSPELSSVNLAVNHPLVQDCNVANVTVSTNPVTPCVPRNRIDRASLIIDDLAACQALPQKGKLLQAVVEAGSLLQTLLVAGSLPRWRNPPRLQPFLVPPVAIEGPDETDVFAQQPEAEFNQLAYSKGMNSQPYAMTCGSSQILSPPMLNFANLPCESCQGSAGKITNSSVPLVKRRRLY